MKAKIEALNKTYLVEFKDEDQFVSFLTKHNDDVNNVEIINEESLPELQKSVEVAKPSMSDGWKTLEKSAFVQKEKGVEKKGMTLGGKYAEFKYEPDKTLDASADDKVSEPKNDSPALTGDEPKAANVESTAKENEVKNTTPKTDAPKKEESKEDDSEDKEEKKEEIKESVEEIDVDDEGDEESYQVWIIDRTNGNKFSECVAIEYSEKDAIEEANRVYNESKSKDKVAFVNYSETGETIYSIGDNSENKVVESEEDDYDRGYEQGKFDWEAGQFITWDDRDIKGESDVEDAESEEFWKGYDEGYEDAKTKYNDLNDEEELDDGEEELNEDAESRVEYEVIDDDGNTQTFESLDELNDFLINDQGLLGEDERLETEEDFRRFEKSTEGGANLKIKKIDYNDSEFNGSKMVDDDLNEVMEAAGVKKEEVKIDETKLKAAKQWVTQTIVRLQMINRAVVSTRQRTAIIELLSRVASRVWRIPYQSIVESIISKKSKENVEEGFKDTLKKAGKFAKNAAGAAAVAGTLMTANPAMASNQTVNPETEISQEQPAKIENINGIKVKVFKDGSGVDEFGNEWDAHDLELLRAGKAPLGV